MICKKPLQVVFYIIRGNFKTILSFLCLFWSFAALSSFYVALLRLISLKIPKINKKSNKNRFKSIFAITSITLKSIFQIRKS